MARKRNQSVAEDVIDLIASVPWWIGCVLALISYIGLHTVAARTVGPVNTPHLVTAVIWQTLAKIGQYIVPGICLIGALASAYRSAQRKKLVANVSHANSAQALNDMSWQEFELLVGEHFRSRGFRVLEMGGGGADGGVDLVLRKGGETQIVQCKQWRAFKVGVKVVRELYGVMAAKGAAAGHVVTSGTFTKDAVEFAQGRNITLTDGEVLFQVLKQAKASIANKSERVEPSVLPPMTPICPHCNKLMVVRTARQGKDMGAMFWGCVNFPACRHTQPL